MTVALYRMYYGEDFIHESIKSIIDQVDLILIGVSFRPWSGISEVDVRGNKIKIPIPIDQGKEIVTGLSQKNPGKIIVFDYFQDRPDNQFTNMYSYKVDVFNPDFLIIMEPDMIWPKANDDIKKITGAMKEKKIPSVCTFQVEHWKQYRYMIPIRQRPGAIIYNIRIIGGMPTTGKNGMALSLPVPYINYHIHNMGFCYTPQNMWWKHWIGIMNNRYIQDSEPDPEWFDSKWISWDYNLNNINLEISRNYRHTIPKAILYGKRNIVYPGRYLNLYR